MKEALLSSVRELYEPEKGDALLIVKADGSHHKVYPSRNHSEAAADWSLTPSLAIEKAARLLAEE
jgi:hypothetical protein